MYHFTHLLCFVLIFCRRFWTHPEFFFRGLLIHPLVSNWLLLKWKLLLTKIFAWFSSVKNKIATLKIFKMTWKLILNFFIAFGTIISIKLIDLRRIHNSVNIVGGWNPHYCWIFPCPLWYSVPLWVVIMDLRFLITTFNI